MKFIKVEDFTLLSHFININNIISFNKYEDGSIIIVNNNSPYYVIQKPRQILDKIEEAINDNNDFL